VKEQIVGVARHTPIGNPASAPCCGWVVAVVTGCDVVIPAHLRSSEADRIVCLLVVVWVCGVWGCACAERVCVCLCGVAPTLASSALSICHVQQGGKGDFASDVQRR
jgi:hypothetical protein